MWSHKGIYVTIISTKCNTCPLPLSSPINETLSLWQHLKDRMPASGIYSHFDSQQQE